MAGDLKITIKGKSYDYPTSSRLGDAALIEQLTGLTHSEWRRRYIEALEAFEKEDDAGEDSAITIGIVAIAVARANPNWARSRVSEFVNQLEWDEIEVQGGDADPPVTGAEDAPKTVTNGIEPAQQSKPLSSVG